MNTDATDFVLPNPERQAQCVQMALEKAGLQPNQIDLVSTHATGTSSGDFQECKALRTFFGDCTNTRINNKKLHRSCNGHAGSLELAGNLLSFKDGVIHPTINVDQLDPDCHPRPGSE